MNSSSKKSKKNSGKKNRNPSEGTDEVMAIVKDATDQKNAAPPGTRSVRVNAEASGDNAPRHMFSGNTVVSGGQFNQAETVINNVSNNRYHPSHLIKLFGTVSRDRNGPIIFLFASRREPQIEAAFRNRQVSHLLRTLPLDNSDIEQTSEDIRHFLTDRFGDIKDTHLRRHLLPSNWPEISAIEKIVTTSSNQFIYASVVVNYVLSPRGNPAHSLAVVRGIRLRDPSSQNPFAQLDALYQHIFSQVEVLDKVLNILAYILITKEVLVFSLERVFLLEDGGLDICFADLKSVIASKVDGLLRIYFLHASLPDFLRDKTRSERYHIDVEEYLPKLLYMFLARASPATLHLLSKTHPNMGNILYRIPVQLEAILKLLVNGAKASDQLRHSLLTFSYECYDDISTEASDVGEVFYQVQILEYLKKLDFHDQGQAYHHVLDVFAAFFVKYWHPHSEINELDFRNSPDLLARIRQIRREKL